VLVDGGWAEPVPVEACRHLGAIHVLAVDVGGGVLPGSGAVASAVRADCMARQLLEEAQLRAADFVVRPDAPVRHFGDFSDPEGAIAAGERAGEAALAGIAAVLERHRSLFVRPVAGPSRVCPHCGAAQPSTRRKEVHHDRYAE
jgi:NTE family protein